MPTFTSSAMFQHQWGEAVDDGAIHRFVIGFSYQPYNPAAPAVLPQSHHTGLIPAQTTALANPPLSLTEHIDPPPFWPLG